MSPKLVLRTHNEKKGEISMKKFLAITLVMVIVLSICLPAFAALPTTYFKSGKNKLVRWGKNVTWKVKCNSASYNRVLSTSYSWIYRAGFTIHLKGSNGSVKTHDVDFTGTPTVKCKCKTSKYVEYPIGIAKFDVILTTWYRPTYGTYVDDFRRCGQSSTTLRVY